MMTRFVQKAFAVVFEIFLWVTLVGGAVYGFVIGGYGGSIWFMNASRYSYGRVSGAMNFGTGFLGALIGFFAALLFDIIVGGMMATFLRIVDLLKRIDKNTETLEQRSVRLPAPNSVRPEPPRPEPDHSHYKPAPARSPARDRCDADGGAQWECAYCHTMNEADVPYCARSRSERK